MRAKTQAYFNRLREMYSAYDDNDSLTALAEVAEADNRARELAIYREQDKTQELITAALERYKTCLEKLTSSEKSKAMTDYDRAYCFAAMDWAMFTLDIVGETPEHADSMVDAMVLEYAKKAGIAT